MSLHPMGAPPGLVGPPLDPVPISTKRSTRQVMVNSLRCAGPDSCVTVYSGRRQPFCTTSSWGGTRGGHGERVRVGYRHRQTPKRGEIDPKKGLRS